MEKSDVIIQFYPSVFSNASRIKRTSKTFQKTLPKIEIIWIGFHRSGLPKDTTNENIRIIRIPINKKIQKIPLLGHYLFLFVWYFKSIRIIKRIQPQKIIAVQSNSISDLPISRFISKKYKAKLFYDAHELETERKDLKGIHKYIEKKIEKIYINKTNHNFVVSQSICNWYRQAYNINNISTIRNLPVFVKNESNNDIIDLRQKFRIPLNQLMCIYVGSLSSQRGIEIIVESFISVSDKHIVFVGDGNLENLILKFAESHKNIHLMPSVPQKDLPSLIRQADIGVHLIQNTCLNHYYCLPNKLWEYLHSGIPVIVSNFPELENIVITKNLGWVVEPSKNEFLSVLGSISIDEIEAKRSNVSVSNLPNWDEEELELLKIYSSYLNN